MSAKDIASASFVTVNRPLCVLAEIMSEVHFILSELSAPNACCKQLRSSTRVEWKGWTTQRLSDAQQAPPPRRALAAAHIRTDGPLSLPIAASRRTLLLPSCSRPFCFHISVAIAFACEEKTACDAVRASDSSQFARTSSGALSNRHLPNIAAANFIGF